jgi:hypothetical protein
MSEEIARLIESNKPFFIGRIAGVELQIAYQHQFRYPDAKLVEELENNAGIHVKDTTALLLYSDMLIRSYDHCTIIAEWTGKVLETISKGQEFIQKRSPHIPKINARELEPFITTIKTQTIHLKRVFPGRSWFEDCTFQFVKPPVTLAGNHQDIGWKEHYDACIKDIDTIQDYDIALIAAGGYGMLLADYIFTEKNKQVIYIGGALQLFFGIIGKRWFDNREILAIMNDNWIRPNKERPANCQRVEKGCYW